VRLDAAVVACGSSACHGGHARARVPRPRAEMRKGARMRAGGNASRASWRFNPVSRTRL
jgi:hypothetical protein